MHIKVEKFVTKQLQIGLRERNNQIDASVVAILIEAFDVSAVEKFINLDIEYTSPVQRGQKASSHKKKLRYLARTAIYAMCDLEKNRAQTNLTTVQFWHSRYKKAVLGCLTYPCGVRNIEIGV